MSMLTETRMLMRAHAHEGAAKSRTQHRETPFEIKQENKAVCYGIA